MSESEEKLERIKAMKEICFVQDSIKEAMYLHVKKYHQGGE